MDPVLEKVMGRPIDLKTLRVRPDQPDNFDIESYLTVGSPPPPRRPPQAPAGCSRDPSRAASALVSRIDEVVHDASARSFRFGFLPFFSLPPSLPPSSSLPLPLPLSLARLALIAYASMTALSFVQAAALWRHELRRARRLSPSFVGRSAPSSIRCCHLCRAGSSTAAFLN